MKKIPFLFRCYNDLIKIHKAVLFAGVLTVIPQAGAQTITLGDAAGFAVLAGAGITNAGVTTITGDVGSYPTISSAYTPFNTDPEQLAAAKNSLLLAYDKAKSLTPKVTFTNAYDLGSFTLLAGTYKAPSSLFLTGVLTLDAQDKPDAFWIFQIDSTLTTAVNSSVILAGGAKAANIFWQVGTSATLGTGSLFSGNILARDSITLGTGASVTGRALALSGAVTLDANTIIIPDDIASGGNSP